MKAHYGQDLEVSDERVAYYREKLSSLSSYMKEIKHMKEFGVKNKKERVRRYRRYVYEAGALDPVILAGFCDDREIRTVFKVSLLPFAGRDPR